MRIMKMFTMVFSACAEVVPLLAGLSCFTLCILRVRGGSSNIPPHVLNLIQYSPRARR